MAAVTQPSPIAVNFNVEIDADSHLDVFGSVPPTVENVVVAEVTLPVNALYELVAGEGSSSETSFIEFWEPAASQGDIKAQLADVGPLADSYNAHSKRLAKGLQKVLCGNLDASAAAPYVEYGDVQYTTQRDFGRLALGALADALFGHVDATAAITNDKAFVEHMLSLSAEGDNELADASGVAARYAVWTKKAAVDASHVLAWSTAASSSDANLAVRLVKAIVAKGVSGETLIESAISDNDANSIANIVKQVLGQDVSRSMNNDGSERTVDLHVPLRFYAGDVIYVNIKVKTPTITVANGQNVANQANLQALYATEQSYTLKITLGAADASLDA